MLRSGVSLGGSTPEVLGGELLERSRSPAPLIEGQ